MIIEILLLLTTFKISQIIKFNKYCKYINFYFTIICNLQLKFYLHKKISNYLCKYFKFSLVLTNFCKNHIF